MKTTFLKFKVISIMIIATMLFGMLPMTAFADENNSTYDPIVVGDQLMKHGDTYELDNDSYVAYEGENGNAVLRLVNFNLTIDDIEDVEFLPEKGYENHPDSYSGRKSSIIYTHLDSLNIILEGENSLVCNIDNFGFVECDGDLVISSSNNSSLTLFSESINVGGIRVEGSLLVKRCNIEIITTASALAVSMVTLSECIGVAGDNSEETEKFNEKYRYKYVKFYVPDVILGTPSNLQMNGSLATWDEVENATGYEVELYIKYSEDEFYREDYSYDPITENKYAFDAWIYPGDQYFFRVRALGNGVSSGDSDWAISPTYERGDFMIGDYDIPDKHYLYNDGTINDTPPTALDMGYAYYEKGEVDRLTLSNFSFSGISMEGAVINSARSLEVELIGDNTLSAGENEYCTGFLFAPTTGLPGLGATLPGIVLDINGEAGSKLTVNAETFSSFYTDSFDTIIDEGVTVITTGHMNSNNLTVNGNFYAENCGILLYGKLVRGENGYISAALPDEYDYGALEVLCGVEEPISYDITDYLELNGGEVVDENGNAITDGVYAYSYSPDDIYYWLTFYDLSVAEEDRTGNNAVKKIIIRSIGALPPEEPSAQPTDGPSAGTDETPSPTPTPSLEVDETPGVDATSGGDTTPGVDTTPGSSGAPAVSEAPSATPSTTPSVTPYSSDGTDETPTPGPTEKKVKKVRFVKKSVKVKKGKKVTLKVKLTPAKGLSKKAKKVKWSINKKGKKVVKFVKKANKLNGKLKATLKALKKGKAKVTCKAPSGKKAICKITVK